MNKEDKHHMDEIIRQREEHSREVEMDQQTINDLKENIEKANAGIQKIYEKCESSQRHSERLQEERRRPQW